MNGGSSLRSCFTRSLGILPSSPAVSLPRRKKYPNISKNEPKIKVKISPLESVARTKAAPTIITMNNNVRLVFSLCCLIKALRSEIILEPLPAGTVLTLGSFSSS